MTDRSISPAVTGRSDEAVAEAAALWSERLREAGADVALRAACEAWLSEDPRHAAAFERAEAAWLAARAFADAPESLALRNDVLARVAARRRRVVPTLPIVAAASLIAAGLATALVLAGGTGQPGAAPDSSLVAKQEPATTAKTAYATAIGERFTATLPDDTIMTLNTASQVDVAYSEDERRIILRAGQAYFDVAHETGRPFIVEAQGREIVALGTAFDVYLVGGGLTVTLVEGRVAVDPAPAAAEAAAPYEIVAGEQWAALPDEPGPEVRSVDTRRLTAWLRGSVVLENDRLADAVAEMNRYSARPILIADPELGELRVSGVFGAGQSGAFAEALAVYFPEIRPHETGDAIRLTRAR